MLSICAAIALSAFGLVAIVLAATGVHGLVAYAVSRRTREIGIRIAMGARPLQVVGFVLAKLMIFVSAGLAVGFMLALGAGKGLSSMVFGASPRDPLLLSMVLLLLLSAAAISAWRPTVRALRLDPMGALRNE